LERIALSRIIHLITFVKANRLSVPPLQARADIQVVSLDAPHASPANPMRAVAGYSRERIFSLTANHGKSANGLTCLNLKRAVNACAAKRKLVAGGGLNSRPWGYESLKKPST
jgi:hypothetical protein